MKENDNKSPSVRITEGTIKDNLDRIKQDHPDNKTEKFKKPLIMLLMGIVFIGCLYLIFKPSAASKEANSAGLNDSIPQATITGLQSDKRKAYELDMIQQKDLAERNTLTSLADYWNTDNTAQQEDLQDSGSNTYSSPPQPKGENQALSSYRNAQHTLGTFYQSNNSYETQRLQEEIRELKKQVEEKESSADNTVQDQLHLMEKSYQLAAKYMPATPPQEQTITRQETPVQPVSVGEKEYFVAFTPVAKNTVSALYRPITDSAFIMNIAHKDQQEFITTGTVQQQAQLKNSIRAVVQQTKTLTGESSVQLRLLEAAKTPNRTIPKGTILTATGQFHGGRLQLKIASIELNGNIIPVDISVYDLDGQQGLYIPNSAEMNAMTEIAANMSQNTGTTLMMTSSPGQQIAGDLSRGVIQGVSGYFSKKIRTPKVTIKAGQLVYLLSKK
ncbi:conjugative transposon protein TraM [Elizabethkingia anophelis]|uniref:Conjugative transposon protein TraM n=1 Tax=Elizabethkingia anophelis TaxID=1117645 RepID=A0A455ZEM1_9FLAO|nr:conjugative transposon protein TraM [Elizabethkingia anophelis]AKH95201.1 hypothetical protein M876_11550 [Elizabethkingia anophelis FMS-007]DAC75287.1 TPA_exp: conjugative transposon protein TraM [Elizabethkingia anophelis]